MLKTLLILLLILTLPYRTVLAFDKTDLSLKPSVLNTFISGVDKEIPNRTLTDSYQTHQNAIISSFTIFPNPTTSDATIKFSLFQSAKVKVSIYNILGDKVKQENLEKLGQSEIHQVTFSTSNLPGGVYLVEISANSERMVKRLTVLN